VRAGEQPGSGAGMRVIDADAGRPEDDVGVQKHEVVRARVAVSGTFDNT
jgi:hypothetical protein